MKAPSLRYWQVLAAATVLTVTQSRGSREMLSRDGELVDLLLVLSEEDAEFCGGPFPYAKAQLLFEQRRGGTHLELEVKGAPPNTGFTIWIKLDGSSPVTGLPFTPAGNPKDLFDLASITPNDLLLTDEFGKGDDGSGGTEAANGFFTDDHGAGYWEIDLDFPVDRGAFQFQDVSTIGRAAFSDAPFLIAVISHCSDQKFHGLAPGTFEAWWWLAESPFN